MSRLVVVSNRVATPSESKGSSGGLAVGVFGALKDTGGVWFGWNGDVVTEAVASTPPKISEEGRVTFATTGLSRRDYDQYYRGFSNATLWPVFHYRNDLARYDRQDYAGYRRVNASLARQLAAMLRPDDIVWVHDYHLIPFAEELRLAGCRNRLGFFLHIPWPTPQVLLNIPPHEELVKSLCCYDVVGFQTESDLTAFSDYIVRQAHGSASADGRIQAYGRSLHAGVYRIGVFPDEIAEQAARYARRKDVRELRNSLHHSQLIMSVDRLDYSKGLVERFRSFEKLLENAPELRERVTLVQVAPPTREDVQTYQQIRRNLEYEAGRINGRFSGLDWTPIRYLNRRYDRWVLMSLFRASQVGFVTPLRDGMNLVAKEYVAAQDPADPGVLVLSRFAGAASELTAALIVNPHDTLGMSEALQQALSMSLPERQARHADMIAALRRNDLGVWRDRFLADLRAVPAPAVTSA
ncbi:MAG: alpha,alpha-trehalose-phosphate synthase (UDP-forming) [Janthinobacterium lividum]